jgi:hypothetical protein
LATHTIPAAEARVSLDGDPLVVHNMDLLQPAKLAPRPYLHPVRSLAGTVATQSEPADHRHHLGLSIAFPDVNGTNFWGGSTYTPASGPVLLDNHGVQRFSVRTAGSRRGTPSSGAFPGFPKVAGSWQRNSGASNAFTTPNLPAGPFHCSR